MCKLHSSDGGGIVRKSFARGPRRPGWPGWTGGSVAARVAGWTAPTLRSGWTLWTRAAVAAWYTWVNGNGISLMRIVL